MPSMDQLMQERSQAVRVERERIARSLIKVADDLLHDPKSDGVDGHVSAVLREFAETLRKLED